MNSALLVIQIVVSILLFTVSKIFIGIELIGVYQLLIVGSCLINSAITYILAYSYRVDDNPSMSSLRKSFIVSVINFIAIQLTEIGLVQSSMEDKPFIVACICFVLNAVITALFFNQTYKEIKD